MISNTPAPLQNMLQINNFYKRQFYKMNNIISLQSAGNFLQVQQNKFTHITISEQQSRAKHILQSLLKINQEKNKIFGSVQDNVSKVQVINIGVLSILNNQDDHAKIDIFKGLLSFIESIITNSKVQSFNPDFLIESGFFYYQTTIKQIRYYQLLQHKCIKNKKNRYTAIYLAGIFLYLLSFSKNLKQYLKNWKKISLNKQQFKPDLSKYSKKNKIDQFIKSILNNQVNTIKMGLHSLQIIRQKLKWIQGTADLPIKQCQKNNYANLKLDLRVPSNQNKYGSRLKHSTSMTNLSSSSNKNRKYKKLTQHHRNEKLFKPDNSKYKTTQSFYTPSSLLMKTAANTSLFRENTKIIENQLGNNKDFTWGYGKLSKQQQILSTLSKANEVMMERCTNSQLDLLKLLQKKQKDRKIQANNQNISQIITHQLQSKFKMTNLSQNLNKKQKFSVFKTIDMCIKSQKSTKTIKIVSTLYSINQKLCNPSNKISQQAQKVQAKKQIRKQSQKAIENQQRLNQVNTSDKIENKIQQLGQKQKSYQDINFKFLCQTIQIFYKQVNLRSFLLFPLYAIYIFYFSHLYRNKIKRDEHQGTHLANIEKVGILISKQLAKSQYTKTLSKQTISSIQILLKVTTSSQISLQLTKQTSLKILKMQFQRNKAQFLKRKSQLMKNKTFKTLIVCLLRNAISISIVKNCQVNNQFVADFSRYQNVIIGKSDYQIDLMSELRIFEQIFQ